ncbi:GIY-YIG nuclease family protein [Hirschia maritima]|uniref:GIY-YIG nuclease family protein n=1 Tax=Hirschia maritima TaxID=1121961 RepID=UPI0003705AD8|nr:GIY-YIG nuclease family protein [Hirschia maritima]
MVYAVYIVTSQDFGTLYTGVTNNLVRRIWEHKQGCGSDFTRKHGVDRLVWFENHDNINAAIKREKNIKAWQRQWKINLIEKDNPHWIDLYPEQGPF